MRYQVEMGNINKLLLKKANLEHKIELLKNQQQRIDERIELEKKELLYKVQIDYSGEYIDTIIHILEEKQYSQALKNTMKDIKMKWDKNILTLNDLET